MNPEQPYYSGHPHQEPQHQYPPAHHDPHHAGPAYQPVNQPPSGHQPTPQLPAMNGVLPTPVVKVLSPFGVAYVFLTISLLIGATSLVGILLLLVNGQSAFAALAFPTAALTVALPTFAGLFLYLKKMELKMPELKLDASKRRSTQFTQIVAFLTCMFSVIGFVMVVFSAIGGLSGVSVGKSALNVLCILVVAGGILAYYWQDEHTVRR